MNAAKEGCKHEIASLLQQADQRNVTNLLLDIQDDAGFTPVHLAIVNNNLHVLDQLLAAGFDVNLALNEYSNGEDWASDGYIYSGEKEGTTPLMAACAIGNLNLVKTLVDNGAAIEAVNKISYTCAHRAAQGNHVSILEYLLQKCERLIEFRLRNGQTILAVAAWWGAIDVVRYLVKELKADINVQDGLKDTPLTLAIDWSCVEVVRFLLKHNADVSLRGRYGKDAITIAREKGNEEIIQMIQDKMKYH